MKSGQGGEHILVYLPNLPIAIVEVKDNNHSLGDGMQQALDYGNTLDVPFVFSTNGDAFKAAGYNLDIKNPHDASDAHGDPDELLADYQQLLGEIQQTRDALKQELMAALKEG